MTTIPSWGAVAVSGLLVLVAVGAAITIAVRVARVGVAPDLHQSGKAITVRVAE